MTVSACCDSDNCDGGNNARTGESNRGDRADSGADSNSCDTTLSSTHQVSP